MKTFLKGHGSIILGLVITVLACVASYYLFTFLSAALFVALVGSSISAATSAVFCAIGVWLILFISGTTIGAGFGTGISLVKRGILFNRTAPKVGDYTDVEFSLKGVTS